MSTYNNILRLLLGKVLILIIVPVVAVSDDGVSSRCESIDQDLELCRIQTTDAGLFSPEILLLKTALKRYSIRAVRGRDLGKKGDYVHKLVKGSGAIAGINANFFDENGEPLGLVVTGGAVVNGVHNGGSTLTGIFSVARNALNVVHRSKYQPAGVVEAVQGGPRLVHGGQAITGIRSSSERSPRSGVCVDNLGRLVLFVSTNFTGISFSDLQGLLLSSSVQCRYALNLDGGGSSQFTLNHPGVSRIHIPGQDKVPVMLGLFLR